MLESIDLFTLEDTKKFFDLKEYEYDGTLSYSDISKLKYFTNQTKIIIDKTIKARENENWKVLSKISEYHEDSLVRGAAVQFYNLRTTYTKVFYMLDQLRKQQIYYIPDMSIIPDGILIDDSENKNKVAEIKDLYSKDNADPDMLIDKIFVTFYKYFHTGQIVLNDTEIVSYVYALMIATGSIRDKYFYEFIKNSAFLFSTFIIFDRLNLLKEALDFYDRDVAFWLSKSQKITSNSWLSEPRKTNIITIKNILKDNLIYSDYHRFLLLVNRHIDHIDRVKNLDPNI